LWPSGTDRSRREKKGYRARAAPPSALALPVYGIATYSEMGGSEGEWVQTEGQTQAVTSYNVALERSHGKVGVSHKGFHAYASTLFLNSTVKATPRSVDFSPHEGGSVD
jgi:hypothetical protein